MLLYLCFHKYYGKLVEIRNQKLVKHALSRTSISFTDFEKMCENYVYMEVCIFLLKQFFLSDQ